MMTPVPDPTGPSPAFPAFPASDSLDLAERCVAFVVGTLEALVARHLPDLRIPGTFAGHRVEPDVAADLVFTLGLLHEAGVDEVAGRPVVDAVRSVLAGIDGAATHTFFSSRVAETVARFGPVADPTGSADHPLLAGWDAAALANLAEACDTSSWIPLLDQGLPRNYAAVLARAELARHALGWLPDAGVLDQLVDRARSVLTANPDGYLDDSTHGVGRYDIYSADVWLFTEPLAERLGPVWRDGAVTALGLVERTGSEDGTAVGWGRSTGVLAGALTIELGALAVADSLTESGPRWVRRAQDALDQLPGWFDEGLVNAHRHRSPYGYRGPFRRLQLTLDVLGKVAWAAGRLRAAAARGGAVPAGSPAEAYPWHDDLVRFERDRPLGVWTVRRPGLTFALPVVGATRSDYLPAPHRPRRLDTPVDAPLVCWAPLVVARGRTWTTGGPPVRLDHRPGALTIGWDHLVPTGDLDPGPDTPELAATAVTTWRVAGRALEVDLQLDLEGSPDALSVVVPEAAGRPLLVDAIDTHGGPAAFVDEIDVDGIAEWRSFWSELPVVHQLDLDPGASHHVSFRVTPELRVASTAHSHHYDRSLYGPLAGRARSVSPPIGPLAGVDGPADPTLQGIDLFHLHWPEWFAFDDLAAHRDAIARLADRRVPVVWTAHNLTPHDKDPVAYDPVYQLWAEASDVVIHHSAWGAERMQARYRFDPATRHVVIPHGHFGDLWGPRAGRDQARARGEAALGLGPCRWRIGLVGAPRHEKQISAFLAGVAACHRDDLQVVCWSLDEHDVVPDSPRIAIAEPYRMVDEREYARRLAVCDLLALPFDPAGDMLATGTAADVIGLGLGALVSDWPYLTEALGDAGIPCGSTPEQVAAALDALTDDAVVAAQAASRARQAPLSWPVLAEQTLAVFDELVVSGGRHA